MMPALDRLGFVPALALFGFTALCDVGCSNTSLSQQHPLTPPISAATRVNNTQGERLGATRIVTSSWYGPGYKGKRTSSGELFDPNRFTAASRTLPLGSIVRVTNLRNGRSVTVKINDRGPRSRRRGLDLSPAAAQRIGLSCSGLAPVKITLVMNSKIE
jgi:rare lipoprotein A